ncbi:hypothetical protein [Nocardia brasiliensis]|uniref:hypothetical protein n=1 Tax=Nocardia brasiliensis TaxID=37326 RepID=UPI0033D3D3CA
MPSHLHERLVDLFRQRPQLAAELLTTVLGTQLPEYDNARLESGDFPDINPTGLLPAAARHFLESVMTAGYEYQNELIRTYFFEGKAEGEASALLRVLRHRGFEISDALVARVEQETDIAQLDVWLDRALDAASLDEVFAE